METPPDIAFSIAPALAPMLQEAENRQKDVSCSHIPNIVCIFRSVTCVAPC